MKNNKITVGTLGRNVIKILGKSNGRKNAAGRSKTTRMSVTLGKISSRSEVELAPIPHEKQQNNSNKTQTNLENFVLRERRVNICLSGR